MKYLTLPLILAFFLSGCGDKQSTAIKDSTVKAWKRIQVIDGENLAASSAIEKGPHSLESDIKFLQAHTENVIRTNTQYSQIDLQNVDPELIDLIEQTIHTFSLEIAASLKMRKLISGGAPESEEIRLKNVAEMEAKHSEIQALYEKVNALEKSLTTTLSARYGYKFIDAFE